ncbi:MAG: hypothetical protein WBM08_00270 [Prochlorococcaceae cyanobacterium]
MPLATTLFPDPITLSEAASNAASGTFGDLDAQEILLEYMPFYSDPPYAVAIFGLAIGALCGLTFAKVIQNRLEGWKQDRLPLLPLARIETVAPAIGIVLGITLFIGAILQVFGFGGATALLVALLLSLLTAGALWVQLARLMAQVDAGTFKAVDFDNFDQFF